MSWVIVAALAGSLLSGVVCGGGPDEKQAMACCRKDAAHCNMPEKKQDCCKPDRTGQNPAALDIAASRPTKQRLEQNATPALPSVGLVLYRATISRPVPLARGFPEPLSREPRITPLLI
jgi:hypothetical protein